MTVHEVVSTVLQPAVPTGQVHVTVDAPVPGVALSPTVLSSGKPALQVVGQVIPVGELVTVPLPDTTTVNAAEVQADVPTPAALTNA